MTFREINARGWNRPDSPCVFFFLPEILSCYLKWGKSCMCVHWFLESEGIIFFFLSFKKFLFVLSSFFSFCLFFRYKGTVHVNIQYIEERYKRSRWYISFFFLNSKVCPFKNIDTIFFLFFLVCFFSFLLCFSFIVTMLRT